jgi:hypothetical protein
VPLGVSRAHGPRCEPLGGAPFLSRGWRLGRYRQGLVELARRRSDLFSVSSSLVVQDSSNGFGAQVIRVELLVSGHHRLQDARVLVRQRYHGFLPARAHAREAQYPLRDPVSSSLCSHHRRLRALDQQHAQVAVAMLGDAAKHAFAAAGTLPGDHAEPGCELRAVLELLEVAHRSRCSARFVATRQRPSIACAWITAWPGPRLPEPPLLG